MNYHLNLRPYGTVTKKSQAAQQRTEPSLYIPDHLILRQHRQNAHNFENNEFAKLVEVKSSIPLKQVTIITKFGPE